MAHSIHDLARNLKLEKDLVDSPWFKALESRNCMTLKGLLETDRDLVRKTSHEGRTVLHVAVIQGCLDLVEYILRLFGDVPDTATFKSRYQVLLTAKDGRCGGVTALGVAQEFLGMEKIIQCLEMGPSHNQQPTPNAQDDQSLTRVREIISEVFSTEPMFDALKASFGEDVDYNFHNIENNVELVFHHAFSQIGREESQEESESMKFVLKVMEECLVQGEVGFTTLKFLLNLRNAQGRPPFHALLASSTNGYARPVYRKVNDLIIRIELIGRIPKKGVDLILEAIEKAPDTKGRTFCHLNVHGIIQNLFLTEPNFGFLKASFGEDVDYNSHNIEDNVDLVFHHAFRQIGMEEPQEESESMKFVLKVMEECLVQGEVGFTTLKFLLNLRNAQGRPPFHALLASSTNGYARPVYRKVNDLIIRIELIGRIPKKGVDLILEAIEKAPDTKGRTFCHLNVHGIIQNLFLTEPNFGFLKASFGEDVDYNFHNIEDNAELVFHHAFSQIGMEESQDESESMKFVLKVMEECLGQGEVGVTTLKFLFHLPNAQGRPPFHALLASSKNGYARPVYPKVNELIDWLLEERESGLESCVKAPDAMGRTIFHRNMSMRPDEGAIHYVFDHAKVAKFADLADLLNQRMNSSQQQGSRSEKMKEKGGATALHLAILHNQPLNVEKLLEDQYKVDLNAILYRRIQYGHGGAGKGARWSPLQLAALLGNPRIVKLLLAKVRGHSPFIAILYIGFKLENLDIFKYGVCTNCRYHTHV